jgi:hypothetical protein
MSTANPLLPRITFAEMRSPTWNGVDEVAYHPMSGADWVLKELEFFTGTPDEIAKHEGEQFALVGYICKRVRFAARNGKESNIGFMIGLIDMNGNILKSSSEAVANTLDTLARILNGPPFVPCCMVTFAKTKSGGGAVCHQIQYTPEAKWDASKAHDTYKLVYPKSK